MSDLSFLENAQSEEPKGDALEQVMALVHNWLSLCDKVTEAENTLKEAKKKEAYMRENQIPEMMRMNRLTSLSLENGVEVAIEELVEAALPKTDIVKRNAALSWLSSHGGGDLIKDTVTIMDPPSSLIKQLDEEGIVYDRKKDVDARSLKAWLKDVLGMKKGSVAQYKPEEVAPELGLFRHFTTKAKGVKQ